MSIKEEDGLEEIKNEHPSQTEVLRYLRIIFREMQRHSTWIEKQCGINSAQLWFLQELNDNPHRSMTDIMKSMAVQQATASNILQPLVQKGYVVKERLAGSGKQRIRIAITPRGVELLNDAPKPTKAIFPAALERMPPEALGDLLRSWRVLLGVMAEINRGYGLEPIPLQSPETDD